MLGVVFALPLLGVLWRLLFAVDGESRIRRGVLLDRLRSRKLRDGEGPALVEVGRAAASAEAALGTSR